MVEVVVWASIIVLFYDGSEEQKCTSQVDEEPPYLCNIIDCKAASTDGPVTLISWAPSSQGLADIRTHLSSTSLIHSGPQSSSISLNFSITNWNRNLSCLATLIWTEFDVRWNVIWPESSWKTASCRPISLTNVQQGFVVWCCDGKTAVIRIVKASNDFSACQLPTCKEIDVILCPATMSQHFSVPQ